MATVPCQIDTAPLDAITDELKRSLDNVDRNDVNIEHYIQLWTHICRMMRNWGAIFNFVVKDIENKIGSLEEMRKNNEEAYKTIQTMAKFEQDTEIIRRPKPNRSGTSLVRVLNKALNFVLDLFHSTWTSTNPQEPVSAVARFSYDLHLASLHNWAVRKMAEATLLTLPNRDVFLSRLRGDAPPENDEQFFKPFFQNSGQIISRVNNLVIQYNLEEHNPSS